jgi:NADH-quinone oxidoreductase subunit H
MTLTQIVESGLRAVQLPPSWATAITAAVAAIILLFLWIMPVVTYMIWWLRRLLGWMQSRLGPNRVGPAGLLQTPADALKLLSKEDIIPTLADRWVFTIAPGLVFLAAFLAYVTIPFGPRLVALDLNVGVVYVAAVTSLTVIGIVLAAWSSNNKYALIAAFRSAAQMVSYEVPLVLAVLGPVLIAQTLSLRGLVYAQQQAGWFIGWFIVLQPIMFICFIAAAMAENNVTPFDIVEAESEIVAGFHVEYSGMKFALFFLAEFANTLTVASLATVMFLGGWSSPVPAVTAPIAQRLLGAFLGPVPQGTFADLVRTVLTDVVSPFFWFVAKTFTIVSVFFWIRATLPRLRIDQLMDFGWKILIPITLANIMLNGLWIAYGWPIRWLAGVNWILLLSVLACGSRKRLPAARRARIPAERKTPLEVSP